MISQKARYAFKALLALARIPAGESLQIRTIAACEGVPQAFLEHIMLDLKQARLVGSKRGKGGGYRLLKAPAAIRFADVLTLVDGPLAPLPCLAAAGVTCPGCDGKGCALRAAFDVIHRDALAALRDMSLADAVRLGAGAAGRPAFGDHPFSGAFI